MQKNSMLFQGSFASALGFFSLLFITSCTKDIGAGNIASRSPGQQAAAFQFTENLSVPVDLLVFIECANDGLGEEVLFSGDLHVLIHVTQNDKTVTVKTHNQPEGIKGVGSVTGDIYNATGVTQDIQSGKFINGAFTYTGVNNFKMIGPGPDNNYLVHENYTLTINANGAVVMEMDNLSIECK